MAFWKDPSTDFMPAAQHGQLLGYFVVSFTEVHGNAQRHTVAPDATATATLFWFVLPYICLVLP